jgi:hypothetical protein
VSVSTEGEIKEVLPVYNVNEQNAAVDIDKSIVRSGMFPEEDSNTDAQTYLEDVAVKEEMLEEVDIGGSRFQIDLSSSLMQQAMVSDQDQRYKLAGTIATQALQKSRELTKAASADPVPIWNEIKNFVLFKIGRQSERD